MNTAFEDPHSVTYEASRFRIQIGKHISSGEMSSHCKSQAEKTEEETPIKACAAVNELTVHGGAFNHTYVPSKKALRACTTLH